MSRALDPSSTPSSHILLSNPAQNQEIYNSLAAILSPSSVSVPTSSISTSSHPTSSPPPSHSPLPPNNTLLEIEFLGKSHPLPPNTHFLQDGNHIAIPKAKLVQAFIHARRLFFDGLKSRLDAQFHSQFQLQSQLKSQSSDNERQSESERTESLNESERQKQALQCQDDEEELLRASAVMLLMDPEHLTAANYRKRIITFYFNQLTHLQSQGDQDASKASDAATTAIREAFKQRCKRELAFVDGYLTSRLHRHTKSPTLWAHRRWVLGVWGEVEGKVAGAGLEGNENENELLEDGLKVVLVAAERHSRNYYAWLHLRWLVQYTNGNGREGGRDNNDNEYDEKEMERKIKVLERVKQWCLQHPGDTSGWSFLQFYLDFLGRSQVGAVGGTVGGEEEKEKQGNEQRDVVVKEVFACTRSFKWTHESVWVFLRVVSAGDGAGHGSGDDGVDDNSGGGGNGEVEKRRKEFEELNSWLIGVYGGDEKAVRVLRGAVEWYLKNK